MNIMSVITVFYPRKDGPPRIQQEIYALRVLTDAGSCRLHYTNLEGNHCSLIISGDMIVKVEQFERNSG